MRGAEETRVGWLRDWLDRNGGRGINEERDGTGCCVRSLPWLTGRRGGGWRMDGREGVGGAKECGGTCI